MALLVANVVAGAITEAVVGAALVFRARLAAMALPL
jgi:hypothetical protein